jgi:hypothetical protein
MEDYDRYIEKLKECKCLSVPELEKLFKKVPQLKKAKEILSSEQNVPAVRVPVTVCGDIHGQFYDLIELFKICGEPPVRAPHPVHQLPILGRLRRQRLQQHRVLHADHRS